VASNKTDFAFIKPLLQLLLLPANLLKRLLNLANIVFRILRDERFLGCCCEGFRLGSR